MSVIGICEEGTVRFVLSYRNTSTYAVGGRRFEVAFTFEHAAYHYVVKDEADREALQAYVDAESADLVVWYVDRGFVGHVPAHTVTVDRDAWHRGVYGCEEVASRLVQVVPMTL